MAFARRIVFECCCQLTNVGGLVCSTPQQMTRTKCELLPRSWKTRAVFRAEYGIECDFAVSHNVCIRGSKENFLPWPHSPPSPPRRTCQGDLQSRRSRLHRTRGVPDVVGAMASTQRGLHRFFSPMKAKAELPEPSVIIVGSGDTGTGEGSTGSDAHGASGGPVPCHAATDSQQGSASSMGPSPATVGDAMPTPCAGRRACDALDEDDDGEDDLFPPIGLKWGFGQTLIPVIDAEGDPVDTIDPEAVHGSLFFKLESKTQWVFSCIRTIPRYAHAADNIKWSGRSGPVVRSITQLPTYQKLVDAIHGCFGKRQKTLRKVDIDGNPFVGGLMTINIDGVTMKCLPLKRPVTIMLSNESVHWVIKSVIRDLMQPANVKTEKSSRPTASDFFDKEDLEDLHAHGVHFWPSKKLLFGASNNGDAVREKVKLRRRTHKRFKTGKETYHAHAVKKLTDAKTRIIRAVEGVDAVEELQPADVDSPGTVSGTDGSDNDTQ